MITQWSRLIRGHKTAPRVLQSRSSLTDPRYRWRLGEAAAWVILFVACYNTLIASLLRMPRISGAEGFVALAVWLLGIVAGVRLGLVDALLLLFLTWSALSCIANGIPVANAMFQIALLASPMIFQRLIRGLNPASAIFRPMKRLVMITAAAQVLMCLWQFAHQVAVDDLKGTFVDTQYGAHISGGIILVTASLILIHYPRRLLATAGLVGGTVLALLADSNVALLYVTTAWLVYFAVGTARIWRYRRLGLGTRAALLAVIAAMVAILFSGGFGNIPLSGYIQYSLGTGGGKVAVANELMDPNSSFWSRENFYLGAGPAQTVSRIAQLTLNNSSTTDALGVEPSAYYRWFTSDALSFGYVGESSVTSPASSLLGILGDVGIVGLALYLAAFFAVAIEIGRLSGYRSWEAITWVVLLVPGFVGEWLEFPPFAMFLFAAYYVFSSKTVAAQPSTLVSGEYLEIGDPPYSPVGPCEGYGQSRL